MLEEYFGKALRQHAVELPVRSERYRHYGDLFADNKQLDLLKSGDWQVVFGTRGTGKTMLLGALHEESRRRITEERVLSVLVFANHLRVSPTGRFSTDRIEASDYFRNLLEYVGNELIGAVGHLTQKGSHYLAQLPLMLRQRATSAEDTALQLALLCQQGVPLGKQDSSRDDTQKDGKGSRNLLELRELIGALVSQLNLKRLDILIDEWSTLDPSASTDVQPEFAEFLKHAFSGTGFVSIKIATDRYQTRFNNQAKTGPELRGLELGADIFEATSLDHALLRDDELQRFYQRLLFKRLSFVEHELKRFDPSGTGDPDEQFILTIFRNDRAFRELIRGALGIPRDFLLAFNEAARRRDFSVKEKFTVDLVQDCLREAGAGRKQDGIAFQSQAERILTLCVKPFVERTNSRVFLLTTHDREQVGAGIEQLLERRIIQEFPKARLRAELRGAYDAFLLDYCTYLDWQRAVQYHHESLQKEAIVPAIEDADPDQLTVSVLQVAGNLMACPHCSTWFSKDSKPYVLRGLCSECFENVFEPVSQAGAV